MVYSAQQTQSSEFHVCTVLMVADTSSLTTSDKLAEILFLLIGFFQFMALPLFQEWSKFFNSELSNLQCDNILKNKAYWDGLLAEMETMGDISKTEDHHTDASSNKPDPDDLYITVSDQSCANQPLETDDADQSYKTDDAAQSFGTEFEDMHNKALLTAQSQLINSAFDTAQPCEMERADQLDDVLVTTQHADSTLVTIQVGDADQAEDAAVTAKPFEADLGAQHISSVSVAIRAWESIAEQSHNTITAKAGLSDQLDNILVPVAQPHEMHADRHDGAQATVNIPEDGGAPTSEEASK